MNKLIIVATAVVFCVAGYLYAAREFSKLISLDNQLEIDKLEHIETLIADKKFDEAQAYVNSQLQISRAAKTALEN